MCGTKVNTSFLLLVVLTALAMPRWREICEITPLHLQHCRQKRYTNLIKKTNYTHADPKFSLPPPRPASAARGEAVNNNDKRETPKTYAPQHAKRVDGIILERVW